MFSVEAAKGLGFMVYRVRVYIYTWGGCDDHHMCLDFWFHCTLKEVLLSASSLLRGGTLVHYLSSDFPYLAFIFTQERHVCLDPHIFG